MSVDFNFIGKVEQRLSESLPGKKAQFKMAPSYHNRYSIITPDHKIACVLVLLFPKNNEWHITLIERSSHHPEDKHAGQISFPGGKLDPIDSSMEACALRETWEEIGVLPKDIEIIGRLSPLFVFVSNFLVHPFVGFCSDYPKFNIQINEVEDLIEMPLFHFINQDNKSKTDLPVRNLLIRDVPYYKVQNKVLWGASAMIMSEWEHVVLDVIQ